MSLSKAFIDKFKKSYGCEIHPIPEDEIFDTRGFKLSGKIEKGDKTLFIAYLSRGKISTYTSYKEELSLLEDDLPENSFILIFKSDKSDQNYVYELKDGKIISSFKTLQEITDDFRNTTAGLSKSAVSNVIDNVWMLIEHASGDDRAMFINLIMCLLHRKDISVTGSLSMSEFIDKYLELNAAEEYEEASKFARSIDKKAIYDGIVSLIRKRGQGDSRNADIEKKIESIHKNNERTILWLIMEIYRKLYKPYVHSGKDDFGELFNQVETKWMPDGKKSQGQIYSPIHIKKLAIKLFAPHLKKGTKHIILDPTCGQGGFTLHFAKYCDDNDLTDDVVIYQNEKDRILSDMVFMRAICLYNTRIETLNKNVFSISEDDIPRGTVTMLLMNPPFGMNKGGKQIFPSDFNWQEERSIRGADNIKLNEWTFLRYSLWRFCKVGAWFFFVIPTSCISENKQNHWDKQQFLRECRLDHVINLREDIFKGQNGGKSVALLVGQYFGGTKDVDDKNYTRLTDLSDDGGVVKEKNGAYEYEQGALEKLWEERLFNDIDKWPVYDPSRKIKDDKSLKNVKDDSESDSDSSKRIKKGNRSSKKVKDNDSESDNDESDSLKKTRYDSESDSLKKIKKGNKSSKKFKDDSLKKTKKGNKSSKKSKDDDSNSDDSDASRKTKSSKRVKDDDSESDDSLKKTKKGNKSSKKIKDDSESDSLKKRRKTRSSKKFKDDDSESDDSSNKSKDDDSMTFNSTIYEEMRDDENSYYVYKILSAKENWIYKRVEPLSDEEKRKLFYKSIENRRHECMMFILDTMDYKRTKKNDDPKCEWRKVKITELFEYIGKGKTTPDNVKDGIYPLISCTGYNNGIMKYIDTYMFDGTYVTIPGNGDMYIPFTQRGKFSATPDVHIMKPLNDAVTDNVEKICNIMSNKFKLYKWSNKLNKQKLLSEFIELPYNKETDEIDFSLTGRFNIEEKEVTRDVKVTELFEIMPKGKYHSFQELESGKYPFISNSAHNNGIVKFTKHYDYDGDYITITSNGSAGYSFVQRGKFGVQDEIHVLKPKDSKLIPILSELALAMTMEFRRKYSFGNKLNVDRLKSEVIPQLPFKPDSKGNFKLDIEGIRYIYIYIGVRALLIEKQCTDALYKYIMDLRLENSQMK